MCGFERCSCGILSDWIGREEELIWLPVSLGLSGWGLIELSFKQIESQVPAKHPTGNIL